MNVSFCEKTLDISLFLTEKEIKELKRSDYFPRALEANQDGLEFLLMNAEDQLYIRVLEPSKRFTVPHFIILINDSAYEDLSKQGRCFGKYRNSYNVQLELEQEISVS